MIMGINLLRELQGESWGDVGVDQDYCISNLQEFFASRENSFSHS